VEASTFHLLERILLQVDHVPSATTGYLQGCWFSGELDGLRQRLIPSRISTSAMSPKPRTRIFRMPPTIAVTPSCRVRSSVRVRY